MATVDGMYIDIDTLSQELDGSIMSLSPASQKKNKSAKTKDRSDKHSLND
jgi:hypothetical protein